MFRASNKTLQVVYPMSVKIICTCQSPWMLFALLEVLEMPDGLVIPLANSI
jgi:hypothetical protein